jgi:hypothetical protein
MTALEIDKIRKKIVREGFTSSNGGSNEYIQYVNNHYLNPGTTIERLIIVYISFKTDKRYLMNGTTVINQWYVEITINHGLSSYKFNTYDYYSNTVDTLLLKVKQYIAFEEFLKK